MNSELEHEKRKSSGRERKPFAVEVVSSTQVVRVVLGVWPKSRTADRHERSQGSASMLKLA